VAIEYNGTNKCGGSIISPDWVVTSAFCVHGWVDVTSTKMLEGPVMCDPTEYTV